MVFVFGFGAVGHDKAELAEAAHNILGGLSERVELAQGPPTAREREIGRFFGRGGRKFQFAAALGQGGFQLDFGGVDSLAGGGLLFFGQTAQLLHQSGELAVRAQEIHPRLFEARQVRGRAQSGERRLFQRFDLVNEFTHKRS